MRLSSQFCEEQSLPVVEVLFWDDSEIVSRCVESMAEYTPAACFNLCTIFHGAVNVPASFHMHSQVPLLDGGEGDGVLKVRDPLNVGGASFTGFLLECVSIIKEGYLSNNPKVLCQVCQCVVPYVSIVEN